MPAGPGDARRLFSHACLVGDVPAKGLEEGIEELKAELFFFVVAGEEDLAVLVEAVDQTFDGVGRGRAHAARE